MTTRYSNDYTTPTHHHHHHHPNHNHTHFSTPIYTTASTYTRHDSTPSPSPSTSQSRDHSPEPMYINQGNPAFEYHAGKNLGKRSRAEKMKKGIRTSWCSVRDAIRRKE